MALIDHNNYTTTLKQSTQGRSGTPDGNIYFDVANNLIELIDVAELPTIDFGAGAVANPLGHADGITMRALYNFENQERRTDETLRKYKRGTDGDYRFSGAFNFVNGVKLAGTDREMIRGSGFIEYADTGDGQTDVDRIYHGVRSLVDIQPTTQPYWTLVDTTDEAALQAATWTDFARTGDINEVVQVFGSTANGDTGAGDFDYTGRTLVVRVRSWGYNAGETTSVASGITEFSGFSGGYGVGESLNPVTSTYTFGDVYTTPTGVFVGASLSSKATPQVESGFNEADGSFSWVLSNPGGMTVDDATAYLDALALVDGDIDGDAAGTYNGKAGRIWYTRNAAGKVVTSQGLFIEGLSVIEQQKIIFTDDAGDEKTYPYYPSVEITIGTLAPTDANAWYHVYYANNFDSAAAVTVQDASLNPIKGMCSSHPSGIISFTYDYSANGGVDQACVVEVEGDGGVTQALSTFTIKQQDVNSVSCVPTAENNA